MNRDENLNWERIPKADFTVYTTDRTDYQYSGYIDDYYSCNQCEYETEDLLAMKIHNKTDCEYVAVKINLNRDRKKIQRMLLLKIVTRYNGIDIEDIQKYLKIDSQTIIKRIEEIPEILENSGKYYIKEETE